MQVNRPAVLLVLALLSAAEAIAAPAASPAAMRDRAYWIALLESKFAVPAGARPFDLLLEMDDLLGSTDPVLRDDVAYGAAARWIFRERRLTADEQRRLLALWTSNLEKGLGEAGSDAVFRRSFSALNLSLLAALDNASPFLSAEEHARFLGAVLDYLAKERDTRGYVEGKGWVHAAAHTADVLKFLARSPKLAAGDQRRILDAVASRAASFGQVFAWGEDERLAEVVRSVARRPDLDRPAFDAWLAAFPAQHEALWARGPAIDPARYPAVQNAKLLLRAAFTALAADGDLPPAAEAARQALLETLRKMR